LHRHRPALLVAAQQLGRAAGSLVHSWRQRRLPLAPDARVGLHGYGIAQAQGGHALPETRVIALDDSGQQRAGRYAVGHRLADLRPSYFRLGVEAHLVRHARLLAPGGVLGPLLGQIQLEGNG
jgi:hypothetical protein